MRNASKQIVAFSKGTEYALPSFWVLSRAKLALKTGKFCHFHGKGWHCLIVLKFLVHFMDDCRCQRVSNIIKSCLWAADVLVGRLQQCRAGGILLNHEDIEQTQIVGHMFASQYLTLHHQFKGFCAYKLFNARPKFHGLVHWYELAQKIRNPCQWSTYMDETWVKQIMYIASKDPQKKNT